MQSRLSSRYKKMADAMGGELVGNYAGTYCMVKRTYPFGHIHGNKTLKQYSQKIPLEIFCSDTTGESLSIESLVFFDIETTGLGGRDALAFLCGFASVTNKGLEVRQYLLVDSDDESAMLEHILSEVSKDKTLVSYNGKTFDVPFMKERMIRNRVARNFKTDIHIDLLQRTRQIFKRRLQSCKLTNIEEKLLQFYRDDDIPGFLVPSVYFEWEDSESLELMEDVLEHNRLDVLSLYFLLIEIIGIYKTKGSSVIDVDDLYSLAKIFSKKKDFVSSAEICNYIDNISNEILAPEIMLFQAEQFKKNNQIQESVEQFNKVAKLGCSESFLALVELAKHYEYHSKDYAQALKMSIEAQKISDISEKLKVALDKRILRLEQKNK